MFRDDARDDVWRRHPIASRYTPAVATALRTGAAGATDITDLRHVRTTAEKRAAEEIANREPCEDFYRFKPLFTAVQSDLDSGVRITQPIRTPAS